jgi:hypothetical protein
MALPCCISASKKFLLNSDGKSNQTLGVRRDFFLDDHPPNPDASPHVARAVPIALELDEVDAFLAFVFSDVSKRPGSIELKEGAAVARHVQWLGLAGRPAGMVEARDESGRPKSFETAPEIRNARVVLSRFAQDIWRKVHQYGEFEPSTHDEAVRFVADRLDTYFGDFDPDILNLLKSYELPPKTNYPFCPPALMSKSITAVGKGNPHLFDDLSERIFAAHCALVRLKIGNRNSRIAAAMNKAKIGGRPKWYPEHVKERCKAYLLALKKAQPKGVAQTKGASDTWMRNVRDCHADKWICMFQFDQALKIATNQRPDDESEFR